jgi:hypothetical protein
MKYLFSVCSSLMILSLAGSVAAATHNVTTAGELTTAMSAAVAGDEIVLANGTYTGTFTTSNSGTSGSKITLRAANQHQAIIATSSQACSGQSGSIALTLATDHWTVRDLKFDNVGSGIKINTNIAGAIIQDNIITRFTHNGILAISGVAAPVITDNVIGHGATCTTGFDHAGLQFVNSGGTDGVDDAIVRNNIIFATGDNGYQAGAKSGYGALIQSNSDDNLFQGLIMFANAGKSPFRIVGGNISGYQTADRNVARDSVWLWGEGGVASDDCHDDSNSFINNISLGNYHSLWFGKGQSDGTRGHHIVSKNLFVLDPFTRAGVNFAEANCDSDAGIEYKIDQTFQDNLFYSTDTNSGSHLSLIVQGAEANQFETRGNNLFYAGGADTTWKSGYTYQASDVHSTQPTFVNAAAGDFSLAPSSAGKAAASDGSDIGITYNQYLVKAKLAQVFGLPTAENTGLTGVTSTSFTVSSGHYYQVWFYIPTSPASCGTAQQFTVEGVTTELTRNFTSLLTGTTWVQSGGPARYITLGRHIAADGTLNVSWQTANCVEKVFIRKLPTADEAFAWLALTDDDSTPSGSGQLDLRVIRKLQ